MSPEQSTAAPSTEGIEAYEPGRPTTPSTGTYTSTASPNELGATHRASMGVGESGPELANISGGGVTVLPSGTTTGPDVPKRKIGIVGFTASRKDAPYDDPEWELWGLNNLWVHDDIDTSKFAAWFDLHDSGTVRSMEAHTKWLEGGAGGLPVLMFNPEPAFPTAKAFPHEDCLANFPAYFTNSVSWMTALAIILINTRCKELGWEPESCEIGIWGIDMADGVDEYAKQRPSCEFFLGVALGMGIPIHIAETSDLLKTAMQYGLENSPLIAKMREQITEHETVMATLQSHHTAKQQELATYTEQKTSEIRYVEAQLNTHNGALSALRLLVGTWAPPSNHGRSTHEDLGVAT